MTLFDNVSCSREAGGGVCMCGATVSTASGQSKVLTKRRNANARFLKDEVGWKIKKAVGGENDTCAGKS